MVPPLRRGDSVFSPLSQRGARVGAYARLGLPAVTGV